MTKKAYLCRTPINALKLPAAKVVIEKINIHNKELKKDQKLSKGTKTFKIIEYSIVNLTII